MVAHDTWLLPETRIAQPQQMIALDLTSSMQFPLLDYPIKAERIATACCRLAGNVSPLELSSSRDTSTSSALPASLRTWARLEAAGIATFWITLKPKEIILTDEQAAEYLDEIKASEELRQPWHEAGRTRVWREIYTKHAKTFLSVGDLAACLEDKSWSRPTGQALEIVPLSHPASLRAGQTIRFQALYQGKPLAGFNVGWVGEAGTDAQSGTTDEQGIVAFTPARNGLWLIRGTYLRVVTPDLQDGAMQWRSDFATLTLTAGDEQVSGRQSGRFHG